MQITSCLIDGPLSVTLLEFDISRTENDIVDDKLFLWNY